MKKVFLLFLIAAFLCSCKKENDSVAIGDTVPDFSQCEWYYWPKSDWYTHDNSTILPLLNDNLYQIDGAFGIALDGVMSEKDCLNDVIDNVDYRFTIQYSFTTSCVYTAYDKGGNAKYDFRIILRRGDYNHTCCIQNRDEKPDEGYIDNYKIKYIVKSISQDYSSLCLISRIGEDFFALHYVKVDPE